MFTLINYKDYKINLDDVSYISPVYEITEVSKEEINKYGSRVTFIFKNGAALEIKDEHGNVTKDMIELNENIRLAHLYQKEK